MANITTFSCLPNEIIICIFEYLEPADKFQAFFHCNARLRKLVKQYVNYNRRTLDKDIERFSTLHSWYKHLYFVNGGKTFYIIPLQGEQERYSFDRRVSDPIGIHWHFWRRKWISLAYKRIEEIIEKYPIKLNSLFHPRTNYYFMLSEDGGKFISQHYPQQFKGLTKTLFSNSSNADLDRSSAMTKNDEVLLEFIRANEPKRLRNIIQEAAQCIWKEIQTLEDVNILELK